MPVRPGCLHRLLCLLLVIVAVPAVDTSQRNPAAEIDDSELEERYVTRIQEEAADYRLARSHALVSADAEALGQEYVRQTQALLDTGASQPLEHSYHWLSPQWWLVSPSVARRAQWLAEDGFADVPYCQSSGELLALQVRALAKRGNISGLYNALYRLWFFIPDYNNMPAAMDAAMDAAEREQNFTAAINLEADDPRDVISLDGNSSMGEINRLFHFMVLHGDRVRIAPRAALGLARSLLRSGDRDDLFLARREYERFCETYPTDPLIFTALTDRALSYMVSYRGEHYDVGSLILAASIVDQAEIEADGNKEKIRLVEALRARIRAWHQDRDLQVARWYAQRKQLGIAWLAAPKGETERPWIQSARYYYREVIRRDSGSKSGRAAALELADLPLPTAGELGAPQALPPAPAP